MPGSFAKRRSNLLRAAAGLQFLCLLEAGKEEKVVVRIPKDKDTCLAACNDFLGNTLTCYGGHI
jgi:hypothetical protein